MEPNVWRIVHHIVFEYFSSSCWTECKHLLFNLFLNQYETVHRRLDREFISSSSFGIYTLVCQLCGVVDPLTSRNQSQELTESLKSRKSLKSLKTLVPRKSIEKDGGIESKTSSTSPPKAKSEELPVSLQHIAQVPDDGFHLDRSKTEPSQSPPVLNVNSDSGGTDTKQKSLNISTVSPEDTTSNEEKDGTGILEKVHKESKENGTSTTLLVDNARNTEADSEDLANQSFLIDVPMEDISSSSSVSGIDLDPEIITPTPNAHLNAKTCSTLHNMHGDNALNLVAPLNSSKPTTFSNDQLLLGLDWYYAVCRLEDLLTNKREDYLTHELYTLYQPVFDPLFKYLDNDEMVNLNLSKLIRRMIDDRDYTTLCSKHEELVREQTRHAQNKKKKQNGVNMSHSIKHHKKEKEDTFVSLLSRMIKSCIAWICKELYYTYRMSEFCVLLTQLLADPGPFKSKLEERRSTRIIRLHKRFNLPSDQTFVNSFSCALDTGKFLHQGKIYFFKDYVSFYSNMLGMTKTQQKFLLPVTEIKLISRKATAWVFNNAIEIQMKDGRNFIFRTFMTRDSTFELLDKLISGQIEWHEIERQQAEELEKEKEEELARLQKEEEREKERALKERERALKEKERALKEKEREREREREKELERMTGKEDSKLSNTMTKLKTAISESKLLNTDAHRLLAQSTKREKKRAQTTRNMLDSHINHINGRNASSSTSASALQHIPESIANVHTAQRARRASNERPKGLEMGPLGTERQVRSAPSSPTMSGKDHRKRAKEHHKSVHSDSETHDCRALSVTPFEDDIDSDLSIPSSDSEVDEAEVWQQQPANVEENVMKPMKATKSLDIMGNGDVAPSLRIAPPRTQEVVVESKEELEAKCATMNTVDCHWNHREKPKVEKDFELMVDYEFEGIGVDEFWDTFWSNEATFSPVDWMRADPLNSQIQTTPWKVDGSFGNPGEEWYNRTFGCVTKLEDLPSFLPKSISSCKTTQSVRYCKMAPYFYVVHKRIEVEDIPYADCYDSHIKIEFTQSAQVEMPSIHQRTHLRFYFAVEWKKSTWVGGPLRKRTLQGIKKDCQNYSEHIAGRVRTMLQSKSGKVNEAEPENNRIENEAAMSSNVSSSIKPSPKRLRKPSPKRSGQRRSGSSRSKRSSTASKENQSHRGGGRRESGDRRRRDVEASNVEDDYDFVFKLGNNNSFFRFRVLWSCCTRARRVSNDDDGEQDDNGGCSKWTIAILVFVALLSVGTMLYTFVAVLGLIHSLSAYYGTAHSLGMEHHGIYDSVDSLHPSLSGGGGVSFCTESKCMKQEHDSQCAEVLKLMNENPTFSVLRATYDSLHCSPIDVSSSSS